MCLEILWIVVGFLYILYKGLREGEYTPLAILIVVAILVALAQLDISAGGIVAILLVLCVVIFFVTQNLVEDVHKFASLTPKELKEEFEKKGYHLVDKDIKEISKNPDNPLKSGGTIDECYKWYCEYKTTELGYLHFEQLDKVLGVPFNELPLDESLPSGQAVLKAEKLAINYILQKRGLRYIGFLGKPPPSYLYDGSDYTRKFYKFLDTYDFQKGMALRKKELEVLVESNFEEFEKLLGYKLPKYEYPFSSETARESRIKIAIYEILHNEGYMNVQDEIDIQVRGKWQDRKIACDRAYELFTMKHSEFEKVYGSKLTEEQLRCRGDIIEIIAMREGWKYTGWENNPREWWKEDDAYELLKD